jgi:hypothetical protein
MDVPRLDGAEGVTPLKGFRALAVVDIDMVWELMGGVVLATRERLRVWADAHRVASGREKFKEWYQGLAERLAENFSGARGAPAFRRHAGWKPPAAWRRRPATPCGVAG